MKHLLIVLCLLLVAAGADDEPHWSFQSPKRPAVPEPEKLKEGKRVRNPIDTFLFRKLKEQGLSPAPEADKRTLVRRAYFDLLGLPPTPKQVERFVNDESSEAWPKLINELLESLQYGERWGRHWLDVVRYADSGGYETDMYLRNAWRYRDYVVRSMNADKPYDRFIQEQIAADELWPDNLDLDPKRVYVPSDEKLRNLEARLGTGLYTLGPVIHEAALNAKRLRYEQLTDWADVTGSAYLGLTMGCARCHDHKFDSITQEDYFGLQAVFASAKEVEFPLITAMEEHDWKEHYPKLLAVAEARRAYRLYEKSLKGKAPTPEQEKEKQRLLDEIGRAVLRLPMRTAENAPTPYDGLMERPVASGLGPEREALLKPVRLLDRGELSRERREIKAALPAALAAATGSRRELPSPYGSRKAFALWLTRPDHPLTARVMVNRLWHWHFGSGIVATLNDFGEHGTPPTHPELLDWLAVEFTERKWSLKQMHRLIMGSAAYRMASRFGDKQNLARDPENRHLWRMNRRRLEGEVLWDSVHAVAGTLNPKLGGRPVVPPLAEDEIASLRRKWHWPVSADPEEHTRRGLYILVRRNYRFPMFEVFDAPVNSHSCPKREVTTVAPQALWGLNNGSVYAQAQAFAARVIKEAGEDRADQIDLAWRIGLGRPPTDREKKEALVLLEMLEGDPLTKLCLGIYNLNEFAFID